ncbi:transposase [Chroococcidiopsis sp.]|uniref:transposase n=1 Tax=Chroococcidiopsis sp. TaxID=3088168 RepID=UPI003F3D16DD
MNEFSETYPQALHIIQLDNGSFHTTPKLKVPENIILLFQPAHCPELNPIERVWQHLKDSLAWQFFNNLDALKVTVRNILKSWSTKTLKKLTGWDYILQALNVAYI